MTSLSPQIRVLIQNKSGMLIPPRSVVVATGVITNPSTSTKDASSVTTVNQYGCGKSGNVMITGPETIKPGEKGSAYFDQLIYVSVDPTISDTAPGEEWGPSDGSWVLTRNTNTVGFFAQGHSQNGGVPKRSMFLRTFERAPTSICSSSSSSASSSSSSSNTSSSQSVSGSSSSTAPCGCITVVTGVSCAGGSLTVTYGQARGCC